ncbi:hypothetical protein PanWU01x14_135630 [Parasponia andersonii]|uniref:Uncharacterized protein n=1 Tax=Parasponia andersonii TaxID=3476 RepID=A0A2P5CPA7_PARAD|nr:hypothetical protein PanWU01x14_135630 [Parasponia andersonii]
MKLKNRWEFKKREYGFDYPSKESKSSPCREPTRKKHKLVSSLISVKKDEAFSKCRVRQNGEIGPCTESEPKLEKGKREHTKRSENDSLTNNDLKRDSNRNLSGEKSTETTADKFVALDDVNLLMVSLLEDLKVTRENLFTWMKEEMQKLDADDSTPPPERKECDYIGGKVEVHNQKSFEEKSDVHNQNNFQENIQASQKKSVKGNNLLLQHQDSFKETLHKQHQNNFEESLQVEDQNYFKPDKRDQTRFDGLLERSATSNEESGFGNCYETLEDLDDYAESSRHTTSTEKDRKESLALHVKPNNQSFHANHGELMQHQKKFPSVIISENCNGGALESCVEGKSLSDHNCHQQLEYQIESIMSSPKKKEENFGLSVESNATPHLSSQVSSSMYLMLPTVLSGQSCFDNHRFEISSSNYIQPTITGNRIGKILEGANHPRKFSGLQHEEGSRNFATLNSDTGFSLPRNQLSFENQTWEEANVSSFKVDGGASSFSGRSYALAEHYVAKKFVSHSTSKAESRLNSFPNLRSQ